MCFISEFKTENREVTLVHLIVLTHLPVSQLVTAKLHRHRQMKATTSSLSQQLHTATELAFNSSTFAFPLAALSLDQRGGKEQSKGSSRVAVVAAVLFWAAGTESQGRIPSDSRSTLNLQTKSTSLRGIPALYPSLSRFRLPLLKITFAIQILADYCPPSPSCKRSLSA